MDDLQIFYGDYQEDMSLADLHVHTRHSDGWWRPEELAEAAVARGLSAIGLTDHDDVRAGFEIADYISRRNLPLRVYPGTEVSARAESHDVHVLGLDLTDEIPPWQSVPDTVEAILRQGGFVIAPHPKSPGAGWPTFAQILALDAPVAVEVFNASVWDLARLGRPFGKADPNAAALAFYQEHRGRLAGAIGGTDAHFRTIGRGLTAYRGDLRKAIATGQTAVVYRPERERLMPWDVAGYFAGLRRLDRRRSARYGQKP